MLRSLGNTPKSIVRNLNGATVHAILATSLCLEKEPEFDIWRAVCPTKSDITTCMPICWPSELQALLPPSAKTMLDKQKSKFDKDWSLVAAAFPGISRDDFLHSWNLVNSRTFYHTTPATEKKLPKEDHMVLQPVADLFNHSPQGCKVSYSEKSFNITTTAPHNKGDEIFIQYGSHSNDFLLVEYGFILPSSAGNAWDETSLDPYICPCFNAPQKREVEDAGFWCHYMLDSETACYRTQTALRMLCLPLKKWRAVLDGTRDEDEDQEAVDKELLKVLRRYEKDIRLKLAEIDRLDVGDDDSRSCLRARWIQIKELVIASMSRLQG